MRRIRLGAIGFRLPLGLEVGIEAAISRPEALQPVQWRHPCLRVVEGEHFGGDEVLKAL
jgi:hypothetical protein